jgi:hypothetical protein
MKEEELDKFIKEIWIDNTSIRDALQKCYMIWCNDWYNECLQNL